MNYVITFLQFFWHGGWQKYCIGTCNEAISALLKCTFPHNWSWLLKERLKGFFSVEVALMSTAVRLPSLWLEVKLIANRWAWELVPWMLAKAGRYPWQPREREPPLQAAANWHRHTELDQWKILTWPTILTKKVWTFDREGKVGTQIAAAPQIDLRRSAWIRKDLLNQC